MRCWCFERDPRHWSLQGRAVHLSPGLASPIAQSDPGDAQLTLRMNRAAIVLLALPVAYVVWWIVGLNGVVFALRRGVFYYWYMAFFIPFLLLLFSAYLLARSLPDETWRLVLYGLGA